LYSTHYINILPEIIPWSESDAPPPTETHSEPMYAFIVGTVESTQRSPCDGLFGAEEEYGINFSY